MRAFIVAALLVSLALPPAPRLTVIRASSHKAKEWHGSLRRENPDGWFTLLIPASMGKVERHADVDGGFYRAEGLEIDYDYWAYEDTPNFLRGAGGRYSKGPLFACSSKASGTRSFWTRVGGRRALIQRCSDADEWRGSYDVYYVTIPRLKVYDGAGMRAGMFNLTVRYKERRYMPTAKRIVRSLDFKVRAA